MEVPSFEYFINEADKKIALGHLSADEKIAQHNFLDALESCNNAMEIVQKTQAQATLALRTRGLIFSMLGDYNHAYLAYSNILVADANDIHARLAAAAILRRLGIPQKSYDYADFVLKKLDSKNAEAFLIKGLNCFDYGHFPQALRYFQKALEINSNDLQTLQYLADTCVYLRDFKSALYCFIKLHNLTPDDEQKHNCQIQIVKLKKMRAPPITQNQSNSFQTTDSSNQNTSNTSDAMDWEETAPQAQRHARRVIESSSIFAAPDEEWTRAFSGQTGSQGNSPEEREKYRENSLNSVVNYKL